VIGQQQVQGVNYAYTLQGWLKAINPLPDTTGAFTLRPDSSGTVVANTAYNVMLDYFNGDFNPISGAAGPDSAVSTTLGSDYRPLYNGNISSMGANIRGLNGPLLYNYQYDQLNRLVHMDAWNRTNTPWSAISKTTDFQESVAYDPNGNIQQYRRNGSAATSLAMDSLNYWYKSGTNQLDHITDSVTSTCSVCGDISNQSAGNYQYDSIGELVADAASGITNITWTVYGKIASIRKASGDTTILFTYDAGGNRVSKTVIHAGDTTATWYVRDAQGNILSVYTYGDAAVNGKDLTQTELDVYGSNRLGMWRRAVDVEVKPAPPLVTLPLLGSADTLIFMRGNKLFELTNHLGNVLSTISDKRWGVSGNDSTVTYFNPDVVNAQDYYPFGMLQPGVGRQFAQSMLGNYRFGFNGKEQDNEVKGVGNSINYGMRVYDPRIGKFTSLDPLAVNYPFYSPYQFAGNKPIWAIDLDGEEEKLSTNKAVLHPGLTILNVSSKNAIYQYNHFKYNHPSGSFVKTDILRSANHHDITEQKQNSNAIGWFQEFADNANNVKFPHDLNPVLSVSETSSTYKTSEIDLGKFGKYIQIENTTTTTEVDITGPAMQENIASIKKTTSSTISYQKVISEGNDGTIDLSFSSNDSWSETNMSIEKVPLASKYEENLKKLTPALASQVKESNQKNIEIVKKAIQTLDENLKTMEKKADNGELVPK
jgi:RHS repeat-associated protein